MNDGRQALQPADPQLVGRVRVGHLHDASQQVQKWTGTEMRKNSID
jgi:hypothetical protein